MKKQLIAIGLVSFLAVPSAVFAEGDACAPIMSEGMTEEAVMAAKSAAMDTSECMGQRLGSIEEFSHGHGVALYGSFRTGLEFGSGDSSVRDIGSRWGLQGSAEVSEGLTAAFRYEANINTANAETSGGLGHAHDGTWIDLNIDPSSNAFTSAQVMGAGDFLNTCVRGNPFTMSTEGTGDDEIVVYTPLGATELITDATEDNVACGILIDEADDSGPGGRHSYVSLSGGFGTVTLGQFWSASANHYGFAVDPSYAYGTFGGASSRNGNSVSYSTSAGDVSFQIDKVTGDNERTEFGATAALGPVEVGVGYWSSAVDEAGFSGVALSAGAAGVNLTIGLGSSDDPDTGDSSDTSILHINGSVGDSGVSYAVQIANSDDDDSDQNLVSLTNSLGSGTSLIFEHVDPGGDDDSTSLIGLKVDF